jgi:hypothetical protein
MGVVFLARNRLTERQEALKVVNQRLFSQPGVKDRFLREIRSAARLDHPNIVRTHTAAQRGELLVLAMEYVDGEDLAAVVKARGPLPVVNACYYVQQVALGLQHAYEKGMVHRDIKPQNLMLARQGKKHTVKILDFGLAKPAREEQVDLRLTTPGQILGTPDFMAPEQTEDAARADIRADLYSLGCTLYFLLIGRPPFQANNWVAMVMAHHSGPATPLHQVRKDVPPELAAVVARLMAKDPAERYQKPVEVVQALAPFVKAGSNPTPAQPSAEDRTSARARTDRSRGAKNRLPARWIWALPLAGLLAVIVGAVALWAGGVFRLKTPEGILVVEVNEPEPDVYVDGDRMTVTWGKDGKTAEIGLKPGTRKVEVKKDGFTVFGDQVELQDGKRRVLTARLVRPPTNTKTITPQRAEQQPPPAGQSAPGRDGAREPASDQNWLREVSALPAQEQALAVADKLKQRNPGFDGQINPKIEDGNVVEVSFSTDAVEDITALRALPRLQRLFLRSESVQSKLKDLSPLRGTALTHLSVYGCARLHDLTPLRGMRLVWLDAARCPQLKDLTPLQGMPLTWLGLWLTDQVTDLSPLRGMPLESLDLNGCIHVEDLTPLQGMRIVRLNLSRCDEVKDLAPLQGMPLASLTLWGSGRIRDLTPLQGMPLTELTLDYTQQISSLSPLQGMKLTILRINGCRWMKDLAILRGMPLTELELSDSYQIRDLTPLQGMPLHTLRFTPHRILRGMETVRQTKSLKTIGAHWDRKHDFAPEEFWKRYDAGEFKPYRIANAIEGESLKVLARSGDFFVDIQWLWPGATHQWSDDAQLWICPKHRGEWVDLEVPVARDGKYRILVYMTKGPDYGIVQFSLNGTALGDPRDFYHPGPPASTGAIDLGKAELRRGKATLRLTVVGTNEKSVDDRFVCGLDCIVLRGE